MVLFLFQGCDKSLSQHPRNSPCQVLVLLRIRNLNERRRIWPQAQHPVAPQKKHEANPANCFNNLSIRAAWITIGSQFHRFIIVSSFAKIWCSSLLAIQTPQKEGSCHFWFFSKLMDRNFLSQMSTLILTLILVPKWGSSVHPFPPHLGILRVWHPKGRRDTTKLAQRHWENKAEGEMPKIPSNCDFAHDFRT